MNRESALIFSAIRDESIFLFSVLEDVEVIHTPANGIKNSSSPDKQEYLFLDTVGFGEVNKSLKDMLKKGYPFTLFVNKESQAASRRIIKNSVRHVDDAYSLWIQQVQESHDKAFLETMIGECRNTNSLINILFEVADAKTGHFYPQNDKKTKSTDFFDLLFLVDSDFSIFKGNIKLYKWIKDKEPVRMTETAILAVHPEDRLNYKTSKTEKIKSGFWGTKTSKADHHKLSYLFVLPHPPKTYHRFEAVDGENIEIINGDTVDNYTNLEDLLNETVQNLERKQVDAAHIVLAKYWTFPSRTEKGKKDSRYVARQMVYNRLPGTTKQQLNIPDSTGAKNSVLNSEGVLHQPPPPKLSTKNDWATSDPGTRNDQAHCATTRSDTRPGVMPAEVRYAASIEKTWSEDTTGIHSAFTHGNKTIEPGGNKLSLAPDTGIIADNYDTQMASFIALFEKILRNLETKRITIIHKVEKSDVIPVVRAMRPGENWYYAPTPVDKTVEEQTLLGSSGESECISQSETTEEEGSEDSIYSSFESINNQAEKLVGEYDDSDNLSECFGDSNKTGAGKVEKVDDISGRVPWAFGEEPIEELTPVLQPLIETDL